MTASVHHLGDRRGCDAKGSDSSPEIHFVDGLGWRAVRELVGRLNGACLVGEEANAAVFADPTALLGCAVAVVGCDPQSCGGEEQVFGAVAA
jgi:hypothetical protein